MAYVTVDGFYWYREDDDDWTMVRVETLTDPLSGLSGVSAQGRQVVWFLGSELDTPLADVRGTLEGPIERSPVPYVTSDQLHAAILKLRQLKQGDGDLAQAMEIAAGALEVVEGISHED